MAKKILIAEDEKPLLKILSKRVEENGYEVIQASDGEEALSKFHSLKPDLLILDIIMPRKNGFEVIEEIRHKEQDSTPIIVISNLDQSSDRDVGKNLGVNDYFIKSDMTIRDLMVIVHKLIN